MMGVRKDVKLYREGGETAGGYKPDVSGIVTIKRLNFRKNECIRSY